MLKFIFIITTVQTLIVVILAAAVGVPVDKLHYVALIIAGILLLSSSLAGVAGTIQKRRKQNHETEQEN